MRTLRRSRPLAVPSATRPLSRRERHSLAVRQRLFDAAMRLFAKRGFTETTVEDITNAADVGKGTFFNYFPSKEELLTAFGDLRMGRIRSALESAERGDEPVAVILRRLYIDLASDPGRSPELARGMLLAMLSSEVVRERVCKRLAEGQLLTTRMFKLAQERGEARRDVNATDFARSFKESHLGALFAWAVAPAARLIPTFQRAFEHFWSGVAPIPRHNEKKGSAQ
jgi:AcrR family transcriptional regulator